MFCTFPSRGGKSGTLPPIERLDTTETLCNLVKDRTRSPVSEFPLVFHVDSHSDNTSFIQERYSDPQLIDCYLLGTLSLYLLDC